MTGKLRHHQSPDIVVVVRFYDALTSQAISVAFYIEREKSDKFCSEAVISAWGSFTCRKSTAQDQRLYFSLRRQSYSEFLRSEKIDRPRPGLNPPTSDSLMSTYNYWTTGAQEWHTVSLVGDVTSPTTAIHYVWFTWSEHREALPGAPRQHKVYTNKTLQCKWELHSSPLNK